MLRPLLFLLLVAPAHPAPVDPAVARTTAAAAAYEDALTRWKAGMVDLDTVYRWSIRWNDSAHDPKAHASRMSALDAAVRVKVGTGSAAASDVKAVEYYVAESVVLAR